MKVYQMVKKSRNLVFLISFLFFPMVYSLGAQESGEDFYESENVESTVPATSREDRIIAEWKWHNADIRSVFKELSAVSGVDIVISDDVSGKISLTVTNKSWKDVFEIICKVQKLAAVKETGYLYVLTKSEYQKQRLEEASVDQAAEQLAPLTREIVRLDNTTASEMATSVQELLSDRGKITVVEHNNSLIVFDTRQNIDQIVTMIDKLDIETEQISISAKIIEVSSGAVQDLGIQWGIFGDIGGAEASAQHIVGENIIVDALDRLTYGVLSQDRLSATLDYLFEDNKGEIVAQPQITTLDNKQAKIFMGQQVPVAYLDEANNTVIRMIDAGNELTVTPHVSGKGRIMMKLNPKKKSYEPSPQGPIINEQSAETNVVVNDGETVVIAGLTSNEVQESESGIPVLKDIPLIGNLFKRSEKKNVKKDLIIFVTPHIIQKNIEEVKAEYTNTEDSVE